MNTLSLHQPYATAMAMGFKLNETRGWPAPPSMVGQQLVIQAALKRDPDYADLWEDFREDNPTVPAFDDLPFGKLVGVCTLVACVRTEEIAARLTDLEAFFGNYEPHRWAWVTSNMRALGTCIPCRGYQGIFQVPDDVITRAIEGSAV